MKHTILGFICFALLASCKENTPVVWDTVELTAPKLILVVGQSNTHAGFGLNEVLDAPQDGIYQLGRFGNNNCVIQACEPLDHHTRTADRIGFALTFAKLLHQHLQGAEDLIIVPCGYGGTGFIDNHWNKGDDLYEDAVSRVQLLQETYPDASLAAILWHQGETDVVLGNTAYQTDLDNFIDDLRTDVGNDTVPFVLGGMVPFWVNQAADRQALQQILKDTPQRLAHSAYADPDLPFVIVKPDNTFDEIHYDAVGERELGQRYFDVYLQLVE